MVPLLIRRLVGLAVAWTVVSLVVANLGPALAARSMDSYVRAYDSARAGRTAEADGIAAQLARQWQDLGRTATGAVRSLESSATRLLHG